MAEDERFMPTSTGDRHTTKLERYPSAWSFTMILAVKVENNHSPPLPAALTSESLPLPAMVTREEGRVEAKSGSQNAGACGGYF